MESFFHRMRARIRNRNFDDELQRELDVHRAMAEDELRAVGVAPDDAREIGIRLALGASPGRVRALLLGGTGRPAMIGAGIGLLLAALAGPALRGFLYGLSPINPAVYAAVVAVVVLTGWAATIFPMRRALRVDPAVTLKNT